ncbi:MAG: hypothetical protein KA314_07420 [Chloroflexi bacterium]|nr:hypothetical protein [Chloroflexota bacterium]MBP8055656.1 hypothetical protein [Chloroflexota bacterium]
MTGKFFATTRTQTTRWLGLVLLMFAAAFGLIWLSKPTNLWHKRPILTWNAAAVGTGCGRFLPLPPHPKQYPHPSPFTPPSSILPPRPPRYAVHTLYLDDTVAHLAAEAGFDTIVQVFPWSEINPERGRIVWRAPDDMVQNAQRYGLNLIIRLDMPPEWAKRDVTAGVPFDLPAYADYITAVASRYRGLIRGYIIWNEPNLAAEWSHSGGNLPDHFQRYDGWVADPADYVGVLGVAKERLHQADPTALVIGGGLAPTNENSPRAMDDRLFLQAMLAAGAADCFDILAVHDYGYGLSPDSHRTVQSGLNLARITYLHDILLAYNTPKPVWITELGYTIHPGDQPAVSAELQAEYLLGARQRVAQEWPWVKLFTVWNLVYGRAPEDEMSGFSLINPDGTPRLAYRLWQTVGER